MSASACVDRARRGWLRSGCRHCAGLGLLGLGWPALGQTGAAEPAPAAADTAAEAVPARFTRPALDTDEGGLWAMMDREETRLRRGSFVVRDATLTAYLQQLVCKLGGEHCQDVRVHVVKSPIFNATMAPNGMMQVWTGLLLRVENEAQLAAVLGHEVGHYLERHSLERLRDAKNRAAFGQFIGMFGMAGALANLAVLAGAFAFSRDQESRADRIGMRLMQRAGYDGREAAAIWDNLLGELKITGGGDVGSRSVMMATHPPVENRRDELLRLAGDRAGHVGASEFALVAAPHRLGWLQDEVRRGQFEESMVLFDRLLQRNPSDAQVLYARGEVFRLREGEQDGDKALADLRQATTLAHAPPEAFRSLGLLLRRRKEGAASTDAFLKYLSLAPQAPDAGLIQHYVNESKP